MDKLRFIVQKENYDFKAYNGWKIIISEENNSLLFGLLKGFLSSGRPPQDWVKLPSSNNSRVYRFCVKGKWYIFKEYLMRDAFDYIKHLFVGSRAYKAWKSGEYLISKGFHTPILVAFGEKKRAFILLRSFLITELVPETAGLYDYAKNTFKSPFTTDMIKIKRSILRSFGEFIGRLHARGIVHGDIRLNNILIQQSENENIFYLLDNERNKFFVRKIPGRLRLKNLVQLNMIIQPEITFTDRLRFFSAYLDENPELKPYAREWIASIFKRTRQRLQKKIPSIWKN